ncbi:MAG: flagellar export protein FliJ [Acidimicrobiia bacterium]
MKRYRFRLDSVLRVRRTQESIAAAELQQANAAVQQASTRVDQRAAALQELPAPLGVLSLTAFTTASGRGLAAAAALSTARANLAMAQGIASEKIDSWTVASQRVTILEHVDERRRAEHQHELLREEERDVDEVVTAAFRRRLAEADS